MATDVQARDTGSSALVIGILALVLIAGAVWFFGMRPAAEVPVASGPTTTIVEQPAPAPPTTIVQPPAPASPPTTVVVPPASGGSSGSSGGSASGGSSGGSAGGGSSKP
jgi:hypothetical protein